MGGGREIPIPIFTPAIVGIGTTIANTKRIDPKSNFFILFLLYTSLFCLPLASPVSHNQQYNAANERRQGKRFRLLSRHLDGADIDDLLPGRVGDALIRERDDADHNKDDACQRVCFHFASSFCCHPFHAAH